MLFVSACGPCCFACWTRRPCAWARDAVAWLGHALAVGKVGYAVLFSSCGLLGNFDWDGFLFWISTVVEFLGGDAGFLGGGVGIYAAIRFLGGGVGFLGGGVGISVAVRLLGGGVGSWRQCGSWFCSGCFAGSWPGGFLLIVGAVGVCEVNVILVDCLD